MSKKTYLFILLVTMMVAVLSVSLTSCSSNDDDNGGFNSSDLIGTWRRVNVKGKFYIFNADGTCDWGKTSSYTEWKLSEEGLLMTRRGGRVEKYLIEFKNNQLHLTFPDGAATEYDILEKIDPEKMSNLTEEFFVGKWKQTNEKYTKFTWEFFPNGSCNVDMISEAGSGTWDYNPQTQILSTKATTFWVSTGKKNRYWELNWEIIYATDDEWEGDGYAYKRIK